MNRSKIKNYELKIRIETDEYIYEEEVIEYGDQNNHKPQPIPTSLAGYVRRQGDTIRVSINVDAFNNY